MPFDKRKPVLWILLGMEGGLYAIRKDLWKPIPKVTFMEDFFQTMQLLVDDYNIAFNPKAIGYEEVSTSLDEEFKRENQNLIGQLSKSKKFKRVLLKKFWPLGYLPFTQSTSLVYSTHHHRFTLPTIESNHPDIRTRSIALLPVQFLLVKFKIHGPIAYFCAMNTAMLIGHYLKGGAQVLGSPQKEFKNEFEYHRGSLRRYC